jgi:hypothetical protein
METTSPPTYAGMAEVIDGLNALHPGLPAPHYVAIGLPAGRGASPYLAVHVPDLAAALAWAKALNATTRVYSGGSGRIQSTTHVVVDGVEVSITGSSPCPFGSSDHAHGVCVEAVEAEIWVAGRDAEAAVLTETAFR